MFNQLNEGSSRRKTNQKNLMQTTSTETNKTTEDNTQEDSSMWVEKYRPSSLDELIAHEQIISTSM